MLEHRYFQFIAKFINGKYIPGLYLHTFSLSNRNLIEKFSESLSCKNLIKLSSQDISELYYLNLNSESDCKFQTSIIFDELNSITQFDQVKKIFLSLNTDDVLIGRYSLDNNDFFRKTLDEYFQRFSSGITFEGYGIWWVKRKNINISFIIPAFNADKTLAQSIDSIIDGNIEVNDEIIVVNDSSSDNTNIILKKYSENFSYIKYITHQNNLGGGAARNTAVENSKNDLIFCLDSDNILLKGSIKKLKEFMLADTWSVCAFGQLEYFYDFPNAVTHRWIFRDGQVNLEDCFASHIIPPSSGNYLYTKKSWIISGGYPENSGALDAWGFGLAQLVSGNKMGVLPGLSYLHRYGHESYWVRESTANEISTKALELIRPYLSKFEKHSINYLSKKKYQDNWFENIDIKPLKLIDEPYGLGGRVVDISGKYINQKSFIRKIRVWLKSFRIL